MDFLGIGPLELAFILLIILLVVGPRDVTKTARGLGHILRRVMRSDAWHTMRQVSREIGTLPNRLAREAELEELQKIGAEARVRPEEIAPDPAMEAWTRPGPAPLPGEEAEASPEAPRGPDEANA